MAAPREEAARQAIRLRVLRRALLLERMTLAEKLFNERILGGLSIGERESLIRGLSLVKHALSAHTGLGASAWLAAGCMARRIHGLQAEAAEG